VDCRPVGHRAKGVGVRRTPRYAKPIPALLGVDEEDNKFTRLFSSKFS
jgi:hypothetical protein